MLINNVVIARNVGNVKFGRREIAFLIKSLHIEIFDHSQLFNCNSKYIEICDDRFNFGTTKLPTLALPAVQY